MQKEKTDNSRFTSMLRDTWDSAGAKAAKVAPKALELTAKTLLAAALIAVPGAAVTYAVDSNPSQQAVSSQKSIQKTISRAANGALGSELKGFLEAAALIGVVGGGYTLYRHKMAKELDESVYGGSEREEYYNKVISNYGSKSRHQHYRV